MEERTNATVAAKEEQTNNSTLSVALLRDRLARVGRRKEALSVMAASTPVMAVVMIVFVLGVVFALLSVVFLAEVPGEGDPNDKPRGVFGSLVSSGALAPQQRGSTSQRSVLEGKSRYGYANADFGRLDSRSDERFSQGLPSSVSFIGQSQRTIAVDGPTSSPMLSIPPFCKELVLPNTEAWFCVAFKELENDSERFDLFGLSGKPLLEVNLQKTKEGSSMSVSMKPAGSPILGSICSAVSRTSFPAFEVKDARGNVYGILKGTGDMMFSLYVGGQEMVRLEFDGVTSLLQLRAVADGSSLSCASRCTENEAFANEEFLEVRVNPGVDAVLSLLCIIGAVLFSVHSGEHMPSGAPPTHSDARSSYARSSC